MNNENKQPKKGGKIPEINPIIKFGLYGSFAIMATGVLLLAKNAQ